MECLICPRRCGADRARTRGLCGANELPRVARVMLHQWEEPCFSGTNGSGAVFFSGCNLGCVYCQNIAIRDGGIGETADASRLRDIYLSLQEQSAHNVNLVTAAPYVPTVAESLRLARENGLRIPVLYNSSGYELPETLALLNGLVDIYLPDLKYVSPALSARFSNAPDYFSVARAAIGEMYRQVGGLVCSGDGLATRGLFIRHLVLPGCVDDSRRVLDAIAALLPMDTWISLLYQYTPQPHITTAPLNRRLTPREYDRVISYALDLGFHNCLIQERDSANDQYTPTFTD